MENKRLRYLLDPDQLTLLNLKLQTREITPEECLQMLKQMMISQYMQRHSFSATLKNTVFARRICKFFSAIQNKFFQKQPAESAISAEELSSWFRPRHL
jgi:hypothetical protein